ncbi:nitroreductase family deazaflavin-dependent oxidoreductase [Pseudomonadales bacterium]|jgi:deazaflavin-dependent oxidoreductase (nitroreductase family)|nr:nitroreductase family deazaflavin-dependent oxidoreductase [Pseudomonadales bacterium]MDA8868520.1 nitroreductase family deazaflavin-dependent oxidoreductase [Pseudomonadales bacterium]MDB4035774.1 nitroreductase family deazaflavin-dependent oxidoreductase [Pseudomonadales bacterium]MDB9757111.1 nitroreductase family deazaflavin-dependent oxidoreductase [Pseudomonadales bacterium]MDC0996573.1 nitroreductase/quinone reductase family protein [Pseudomonadales bacterium]|tara:strand:- start:78 stop:509 length:432 start_codon:yes stop_codon:yes gene_type:complete
MSIFSTVLKIHQSIYESTDGLLGHKLLGVPTLLLRTKGRKSGEIRTTALIYLDDNNSKVVVASKAGDSKPPAWLLNLQANPKVEYQLNRDRVAAVTEVIERGHPDYERLWKEHNDRNAGRYDEYQSLTERPIPLVRLVPSVVG